MESFSYVDIQDWTGQDCLNWATKTCMQLGLKFYEVDFEGFGFLTGKDLLQFNMSDFCRKIDKINGPKFYESFIALTSSLGHHPHHIHEVSIRHNNNCEETSYIHTNDPSFKESKEAWNSRSWSHLYNSTYEGHSYTQPFARGHPSFPGNSYCPESEEEYQTSYGCNGSSFRSFKNNYDMDSCNYEDRLQSSSTPQHLQESPNCARFSHLMNDRWEVSESIEGNYSCSSDSSFPKEIQSTSDAKGKRWKQKIKNKTRPKRVRDPFVWEFLLMLLKDRDFNPSHIRWEDKRKGTFKLMQKEEIAKEWGERTEKHKQAPLSYGHFSRSLRYHYTSGYLLPVSEKHLVYKFGPKVMELIAMDLSVQEESPS